MSDVLALQPAVAAAQAPTAVVGGKGRQLGVLRQRGLPVPDFFVIPAGWCDAAAASADVPPALASLLQAELASRGWLETPLAVRSSAAGEDAAQASFAGIFVSRLNLGGISALTAAVGDIWRSLHSPAARAYREKLGLDAGGGMAVVVMPLLPAVASGIAFTCDPVSGREDRMVVHANWGLGETLVGGESDGDEYVFAEDSVDVWRMVESRIGDKRTMALPAPAGGTVRQPVPAERVGMPVLSPAGAEALAALLRDAALACDFVAPFFDLEWVWDGRQFWLTQARPVTRRPDYRYAGLHGQAPIWTRGNTCEIMPEPLQAMDWNFSRRGVNDLLLQGWRIAAYPLLPGIQRAGLFDGHLYLDAATLQWEAWDTIGLAPARFNALMGGHQPAIDTCAPTWRDRFRRLGHTLAYLRRASALGKRGDAEVAAVRALTRELRAVDLPADNDAIIALLHRVLRPAREYIGLFFLQGSGGGSLSLLLDTLERHFPGEGAAIGAGLLAGGEPSVTAQQGYALLALARTAKTLLDRGCPWPVGDDARREAAWQPWLRDPAFAAELTSFLDQYGHRGHYETYLRSPRWAEVPVMLLEQLPVLAEVDADVLRERQRQVAAAAWQRLPFWLRPLLRAQVKAATRDSNRREAARSALIALLAVGRRWWLQIATRLVDAGVLSDKDEVFHLLPSEIERHARGLLSADGVRARLRERRQRYADWLAADPPDWFRPAIHADFGQISGLTADTGAPVSKPSGAAVWRGVATGTGRVRGRVRRLRHPADGIALQPGEILVAATTDPGWTPLFLKAGGLVVETGGYLSHGAIVAREFALPAVVNLPGIFDALTDGDLVEVDGLQGVVRRI